MKAVSARVVGSVVVGLISLPQVAFANEGHRGVATTVGVGHCAKGPCLHMADWKSEKESCSNAGPRHHRYCGCHLCSQSHK